MWISFPRNNRFCGRHNLQFNFRVFFEVSRNQKVGHWLFMRENLRSFKMNMERILKNTNIYKIRKKIRILERFKLLNYSNH